MKKILFLTLALFCSAALWADISPKPEMDFTFIYPSAAYPRVQPEASAQIQCKDNQCITQEPLREYGIQRINCTQNTCHSVAYDYDGYQKLIIGFTDGTKKESNVFRAPDTLRSAFNVQITDTGLNVTPGNTPQTLSELMRADAWISLLVILILELIAAYAYLSYTGKNYRVLYAVFVANIITTAICWLVLAKYLHETAFLWLSCLGFETVFVWVFNRKRLSLYDSFMLNIAANITSYSIGSIVLFAVAPWLM